jgi:ketosteroid isomerase-like protein
MSDTDAVLFTNEAFYRAFADRDEAAMDDLWSASAQVACLHPGWGPLMGREDVLSSWMAIIRNPESPAILCHDARAHVYGDTAYVICFEEVAGNVWVATTGFVREGRVWKMVHHQAGPTSVRPDPESGEPAGPVN